MKQITRVGNGLAIVALFHTHTCLEVATLLEAMAEMPDASFSGSELEPQELEACVQLLLAMAGNLRLRADELAAR